MAAARVLLAVLPLALALGACQRAMSIEEARKVTATLRPTGFVPPPRTINDIVTLLERRTQQDLEIVAEARALVEQEPPAGATRSGLAAFLYRRGRAAHTLGRHQQEVDDLVRSVHLQFTPDALFDAALVLLRAGRRSEGVALMRTGIARIGPNLRGWLIPLNCMLADSAARAGDLDTAQTALRDCLIVHGEALQWRDQSPETMATHLNFVSNAQGRIAETRGRYAEAEAFYRGGIAALEGIVRASQRAQYFLHFQRGNLAAVLAAQGRLVEAESEARKALVGTLEIYGRNHARTAVNVASVLTPVLMEQGRFADAERLARIAVEICGRTGCTPDSLALNTARQRLAATLVAQGRWAEALREHEALRAGAATDPQSYAAHFRDDPNHGLALLKHGQLDQGLAQLAGSLERKRRELGDAHAGTAEVQGLLAMALVARGDRARALREFRAAAEVLLRPSFERDEEATGAAARDQRVSLILAEYVGLLADIRGTTLERETGADAAAEAFRLADVARGRSVQRALDAGAARTSARTPALAELIRREQDARKQISALHGVLAAGVEQGGRAEALRQEIAVLRRAQQSLAAQIEREFPAYAQLVNPPPMTLAQAQAALRPGEALIATYVTADRTFVWAIPQRGSVGFAPAPLGARALDEAVGQLRQALNPSATILEEIPAFDVALAHRLYAQLLEPVRTSWEGARSLLVVPHGPLAQLPLGLLPTAAVTPGPDRELLFAGYRQVPWLIQTHAVTSLPSVAALGTLRGMPPADPGRRPFIGFGDPLFSEEQARRAGDVGAASQAGLSRRGVPVRLRSAPRTEKLDSSQLGALPRLPETADEVRGIAAAMGADLTRDVFVGAAANEHAVKTLDLSGYRVIVFATHGLMPGELDGLSQPALALSAPEVAKVEGDGVLTMGEILGLRLNADWVVLSACNTASGRGAGSEAISGLGRAFFYAGARALLVSSWPVETTSARALTTELFRRQSARPGLERATALQETMRWMITDGVFVDPETNRVVASYGHPIFWASFMLVGDGGAQSER